jgi:ABC-type uncharacterized transport system ATPase subunit
MTPRPETRRHVEVSTLQFAEIKERARVGKTTSDRKFDLKGDEPRKQLSDDAFELANFARAIADVVRSRVAIGGYALGIEGPWGAGKSTLLNFVAEILTHDNEGHAQVVRFDPWLVGKKEALLAAFFTHLTTAIEDLRVDLEENNLLESVPKDAFARLRLSIAKYAKYLSLASEGARELASLFS